MFRLLPKATMMLTRKMTLLLLATAANAWKFTIYGDGDCESTPSGDLRGDGAPFLDPNDTSSSIMTNALSPTQTVPVFLILIEGSGLKKWVTAKLICMLMRTIAMMAYRSSFMMRPIRASALVLSSNGTT